MRAILTVILCALPGLALAQDEIPDAALQETFDQCVPVCREGHSYAFCTAMCGCVINEMGRHWTMADFRARGDLLAGDAADPAVQSEVQRIANYCAAQNR